jgi:hypothetical protein
LPHVRTAQRIHGATLDAYRPIDSFPTSIAVEGDPLFLMNRRSWRLEPASGHAAPAADAFAVVNVHDTGHAIDPPGSVLQRAGEVTRGVTTLLAHDEGEVIGKGIADDL